MSKEKLEKIRRHFIKELGEPHGKWRIKKREITGTFRYLLVEALLEAKEPLRPEHLAYIFNKGITVVRQHLRVLDVASIICSNLTQSLLELGKKHYTVCPSCPIKDECNEKLDFWLKSGLMDAKKE